MGGEDEGANVSKGIMNVSQSKFEHKTKKSTFEQTNGTVSTGEDTLAEQNFTENRDVQDGLNCSSLEQIDEVSSWKGWAEIENDPEIFTILIQEWGASQLHVEEVLDISALPTTEPDLVLGLIFLSRWVASDKTQTSPQTTDLDTDHSSSSPWFANQISKFSCGTVSLMNILMNGKDYELSEALSNFKVETQNMSAKNRGLCLDRCDKFRDVHNSFSTLLDRMIVDQMIKEEFQATKRSRTNRRKRGRKGRKQKSTSAVLDDEEAGNHFVAYISMHSRVWKLDGMEAKPEIVGAVSEGMTWLDVASAALMQQIEGAINANYEVSLMKVVKSTEKPSDDVAARVEKCRRQEDWAPFIEHMIRLHAEKGDLGQRMEM